MSKEVLRLGLVNKKLRKELDESKRDDISSKLESAMKRNIDLLESEKRLEGIDIY